MLHVDLRSVVLGAAICFLSLAVARAAVRHAHHGVPGYVAWLVSDLLFGAGLLAFGLRAVLVPAHFSIIAANLLCIAAMELRYDGVRRFLALPPVRSVALVPHVVVSLLVVASAYDWGALASHTPTLRYVAVQLLMAYIAIRTTWVLLRPRRRDAAKETLTLAITSALMTVASLGAIGIVVTRPLGRSPFALEHPVAWYFWFLIGLAIVWSLSSLHAAGTWVFERLRQSEERFRLTIDEAPVGMAIVALDGRFVRVNHSLCDITGYPPAELTGLTFQSITHPEDLDADLALARRLVRAEIPRYQLAKRYVRKDGSLIAVRLHVALVRHRNGSPLYYIAQVEDVTTEKRAESVSQRLATVVRHSNDAITTQDLDGNILTWNGSAELMYGYSEAEALKMNIAAIVPEGNTEALAYLDAIRRGDEAPSLEVKRQARDGRILDVWLTTTPLFDKGHPVAVATIERDVTERKVRDNERQYHLDAMERFYRVSSLFLSDESPQAILQEILETAIAIAHADSGNIQVLDAASSTLEVVAHRNLSESWLRYWARIQKGTGACGTALATGHRTVVEDVTRSPIFVGTEALDVQLAADIRAVQSTPLISRSGTPLGMISTHWRSPHRMSEQTVQLLDLLARRAADILERVQMEEALRGAIQERDRVLGIVAHDLRNPLTSILMQSQAMHRIGPEPERRNQRPAQVIARAATRMNRLIRDLLDVTRIEAGTLTIEAGRLSPSALAAEAVDMQLALAASASIDLRLDVPRDLSDVWGDRDRLLQVFENLIGNAIKFTRSGGQVTVTARPIDSAVLFCVKDTGNGISAEDLPHVFDRFWQAAASSGRLGAGLGLPITKGIVEAHGGRIRVESTVGRGSSFYFSIPTRRPAVERAPHVVH
jgi:PAS domain S-box-containing protein